ncbi:MAG: 50S ribosomal protein L29 [Chloroflexota bacterium]
MKIDELRAMSSDDIKKQIADSQHELLNLRFRLTTRQLVNNQELVRVRRNIARLATILREREMGIR